MGGSSRTRPRAAPGAWNRPSTRSRRTRSGPWPRGTWGGCPASRLSGLRRDRLRRVDPDALLRFRGVLELHASRDGREHGVVVAETRAGTGKEGLAALPDDDRSGRHELAVLGLDAQSLA